MAERDTKTVAPTPVSPPSGGQVAEWLRLYAKDPEQTYAFCYRHAILDHTKKAIELVKAAFSGLQKIEVRVERDPEVDGDWLVIDITVADDTESFLAAYDRCKTDWVLSIPPQALSFIQLSYDLV